MKINCRVDCQAKHVVYIITCSKCKKQFVAQTHRSLGEAFQEHLTIVSNRITNQPTGRHFTLPGISWIYNLLAYTSNDPFEYMVTFMPKNYVWTVPPTSISLITISSSCYYLNNKLDTFIISWKLSCSKFYNIICGTINKDL